MSRFLFGLYVEGDLREIRDHIGKDNPEAARSFMLRFVQAFRLLAKRPELGHVREDLLPPELRIWPVGSYLIIYLANRRPIEIAAVIHGSRDVPHLINRGSRVTFPSYTLSGKVHAWVLTA